jgi:hypothetical protein
VGIKYVADAFWAFFRAGATGNAQLRVHVPGRLNDGDFEITDLPGDTVDVGQCQQFDVGMPADLDQFGRDNSHGAFIGGEGLVQLGHDPTNGR